MSVDGCSLQLLRACNIRPEQLMLLLQPFGGSLPTTDAEFNLLCTHLRRHGRVAEGAHGNIATVLRGPFHQARPGAYFTDSDSAQQEGVLLSAAAGDVAPRRPLSRGPPGLLAERGSPEASSAADTPCSPSAYQDGYSTSAFPAIPFDDDSTDSETSSDNAAQSFRIPEFLR